MNLKELTWPVRIYWDLPLSEHLSLSPALRLSEELIALKVLFLSLRAADAPFCFHILEALRGKGLAVSLTLPGEALTGELIDSLRKTGVKSLFAEFASLREATGWFEKILTSGHEGSVPGLAFDLNEGNYRDIPGVVSCCLDRGVRDLVFPIQRLTGSAEAFCLTGKKRAELVSGLNGLDHRSLRITIHDPFLWQVFFPEAPYHEGGCQAANSMLYISPLFKVFPCPAMPLELGDLRATSLREIVLSAGKKELRQSLLIPPGECAACDQAATCLGGCRGRALAANGSLDVRDPSCA